MNADKVPSFDWCPRCGEGGLEQLKSYSHCVSCLGIFDKEDPGLKESNNVLSIENVRRLFRSQEDSPEGVVLEFPQGA